MRYLFQNTLKILTHPYLFFEEALEKNNPAPASVTFLISWLIASLGWFFVSNSLLGNLQLIPGMLIALATYPIVVTILYLLCRILVRETRLSSFFNVWGFSYLPTLLFTIGNIMVHLLQNYDWFISTMNNPLFQICLWTFIFLTLLWKGLLLAITLRLAGNLNLIQIIQAITIIGLIVLLFWRGGFLLGWFKVPFI
jgi:hypothetical protein